MWVLNGHFSFPLWYKRQGVEPLTLLFWSSSSWGRNRLSLPLILKLPLLRHLLWLVGWTAADVPAMGAPAVITASHHPVVHARMPRPVGRPHRLGESLICASAYLDLLLYPNADFYLLIGVGPYLLHVR
jgi:hypothetical protein